MSRKHSFKLTLSNNVTEKQGINYLVEEQTGFFKIDKDMKKERVCTTLFYTCAFAE